MLLTYNLNETWRWNLDHAPDIAPLLKSGKVESHVPLAGRNWNWCGIPTSSSLGIPAGPLLDSRWLLYYAAVGFDILVYKTVRSVARECYPLPNLVPVDSTSLATAGSTVKSSKSMHGSWAVSFGMPSQSPEIWRYDISVARAALPEGKVLVVSVVGTQNAAITDKQASLEQLAEDFAKCAAWAIDSGAHGIEANFSCPNVSTADGQLYQQPEDAGFVAACIRSRIGDAPLVLKIGKVNTAAEANQLLECVAPFISGLAMTNSIAARVADESGTLLFDGQPRGICGSATLDAGVDQIQLFRKALLKSEGAESQGASQHLHLIGVGGISTADHVTRYLNAGADSIAIATAAMINPGLALNIRASIDQ
ncbi:MAG: hypothetical protein WBH50_17325 [Fuerstiella sp.]